MIILKTPLIFSLIYLNKSVCSLSRPITSLINTAKFTKISTKYISELEGLYSIAVSNGKLISLPKDLSLASEFRLRGNYHSEFFFPIKNAVFLSKEVVFVLFDGNNNPKELRYDVFKLEEDRTELTLTSLDHDRVYFDFLSEDTPVENYIYVEDTPSSAFKTIFVFNTALYMVRYDSHTQKTRQYGNNSKVLVLDKFELVKGVSLYMDDVYVVLALKRRDFSTEKILQMIRIQFRGDNNQEIAQISVANDLVFQDKYKAFQFHVCESGLKYVKNYATNFFFISGVKAVLANALKSNTIASIKELRLDHNITSVRSLAPLQNTVFYAIIAQCGPLYKGRFWEKSTQSYTLIVFENLKMAHHQEDSILVKKYQYDLSNFGLEIPLGDLLTISSDSNAMIVAGWSNYPNIVFLGQIFDMGCQERKTRFSSEKNTEATCVYLEDTPMKHCISILDPWSMSCYKCHPDPSKFLSSTQMVGIPRYHLRKACYKKDLKCPSMKVSYHWDTCYKCSKIGSCSECTDFSHWCSVCEQGFALNIQDFTCFNCSSIHPKCSLCVQQGVEGDEFGFSCSECEIGHYLADKNTCLLCTKGCTQCTSGAKDACQNCSIGYKPKVMRGKV